METIEQLPGEWMRQVQIWAEAEELILEVYAFGSRVKGTARPDSDLDLALDVDGMDEGEKLGNAMCLKPRWKAQLEDVLPVVVHLQSMHPDDIVVTPAVRDHGVLLFRRGQA